MEAKKAWLEGLKPLYSDPVEEVGSSIHFVLDLKVESDQYYKIYVEGQNPKS